MVEPVLAVVLAEGSVQLATPAAILKALLFFLKVSVISPLYVPYEGRP
jgi:hypothetical protein